MLTAEEAVTLPAAQELGDASLRIEGTADVAGSLIPFSVSVPLLQTTETEKGIPVVRKNGCDDFTHEVRGSDDSLTIRFDPLSWLGEVNFAEFSGSEVVIDEESRDFWRIRNALSAGARPEFEWSNN